MFTIGMLDMPDEMVKTDGQCEPDSGVPSEDVAFYSIRGGQSNVVDLESYRVIGNNKALMDILLLDRNTGHNVVWATDDYSCQGPGFGAEDQILYLFIVNPNRVIRPRFLKTDSEQRIRSKDRAEVFTPPWIVNKQNNLVDEQWTGTKNPFNIDQDLFWTPTKCVDLGDRDWKEYVKSLRLEVCCGEAPYLTTRYDPVDGIVIPVRYRVGLLDRKLRVVSENVDDNSPLTWIEWAKAATRSVYAYDFQGDNVVLARENLLLTVSEHYHSKFGCNLEQKTLEEIAKILSWNIWQMDGISYVVPFTCKRQYTMNGEMTVIDNCTACKTGKGVHSGTRCRIMDWEKSETVEFTSLMIGPKRNTSKMAVSNSNSSLDKFMM